MDGSAPGTRPPLFRVSAPTESTVATIQSQRSRSDAHTDTIETTSKYLYRFILAALFASCSAIRELSVLAS